MKLSLEQRYGYDKLNFSIHICWFSGVRLEHQEGKFDAEIQPLKMETHLKLSFGHDGRPCNL